MNELLGLSEHVDLAGFATLVLRFVINAAFLALVLLIFQKKYRSKDGSFTCAVFNVVTFLMCFLLSRVPIELGFALGLFAVFGILRYRTEAIRTRDLTYLFAVIGVGILNGVSNDLVSFAELLFVNVVLVTCVAAFEYIPGRFAGQPSPLGREQLLVYDKLSLLAPGREQELYLDLFERTGLRVHAHRVERIDLLRESAQVVVHHDEGER